MFDHRHLGDSENEPRQRFRKAEQLTDWRRVGERDVSVSRRSVERLAARAPTSELRRYEFDHFEPFVNGGPERVAEDQIEFLSRQGLTSR